jgi:Na+/H+ antiporter NhaD/arsenite permease-like protein
MNTKQTWNNIMLTLKTEKVFTISLILALITSIVVMPKISYINFEVLILMFNLMLVISVFEKIKLLDKIAVEILSQNKNLRVVSLILIGLCFVFFF